MTRSCPAHTEDFAARSAALLLVTWELSVEFFYAKELTECVTSQESPVNYVSLETRVPSVPKIAEIQ